MALTAFALPTLGSPQLNYASLRRSFLIVGGLLAIAAPLVPDPVAFAVGAFVPWLILRLAGTPTLPSAVAFFLLWQWLQVFARPLVGVVDSEPMSRGLFGPWVVNAYWYMMAGIVTMAAAFRLALHGVPPPTTRDRTAHFAWRPIDMFAIYVGALVFASASEYAITTAPSLYQQFDALARFKVMAAFLLFSVVLSTGRGWPFLAIVVGTEILLGLSALLGEFRGVFIFLLTAALAVRIKWSVRTTLIAGTLFAALLGLALFWTSVKAEYRDMATGGSADSQTLQLPLEGRIGYMLDRVAAPGNVDWSLASYSLLHRLAYVDIFGSVIGVDEFISEPVPLRQWQEAIAHTFQPRFLFPGKQALSDTEVYARLTRTDPLETIRGNTSISVGYLAECYVDLGFPGMLGGVFLVGLAIAAIVRYFMVAPLPWMAREGTVLVFLYAVGSNGVEVSLPKLLGTSLTFFVIYALLMKFAFPAGIRRLDARAGRTRRLPGSTNPAFDVREREDSRSSDRELLSAGARWRRGEQHGARHLVHDIRPHANADDFPIVADQRPEHAAVPRAHPERSRRDIDR